jgi:hypothetical protein
MESLNNFFGSIFNIRTITHERLYTFAIDHISRMQTNNPGDIYNVQIGLTQTAADKLKSKMTKQTGDTGTREGGTSAKDGKRAAIEFYVGNQIGVARGLFGGKADPRFIETYPELMNAVYGVTDVTFNTNIAALITKAHKYVAVLGSDFEDKLTTMYGEYTTADDSHVTETTAVSTDKTNEAEAALELSDQMTDNAADIGKNNRRSTTAQALYFNVTLLEGAQTKQIKKGTPEAHTDKDICPIEYAGGKHTKIQNKGAVKLIFGMKLLDVKVGTTFEVLPGKEVNPAFSDYFSNGDALYVVNPEDSIGMFQLDIVS